MTPFRPYYTRFIYINRWLLNSTKILFVLTIYALYNLQNAKAQNIDTIHYTVEQQLHKKNNEVSTKDNKGFLHQLTVEYRGGYVIPSKPFYKTDKTPDLTFGFVQSTHLKYAFALPEESLGNQLFPNTYQGLGIAIFDFGNTKQIGTPKALYFFQKSRITTFSPRLSLDYEWNFGISTGWQPYNAITNPSNVIVGSTVNAYINLGASMKWKMADKLALSAGIDFTHFSNGNTEYPNAGVDIPGYKLGISYDISKNSIHKKEREVFNPSEESKYISYDFVVFGSWRRKGVNFFGQQIPSPQKYPVIGGYFAPMYNLGNRLRTGISLDMIYDGSANVYTEDYIVGTQQEFFKPDWNKQVALGLSARVDYVMPFFTIAGGIGTNVLHAGGDFNGTYQSFALKIQATRSSFVHIGYNIKDFHEPNYLMLGLGYRFNNKNPSLLSK